jgi:hypothetical protein
MSMYPSYGLPFASSFGIYIISWDYS